MYTAGLLTALPKGQVKFNVNLSIFGKDIGKYRHFLDIGLKTIITDEDN